ncbi:hypothetical protein [Paenibacillus sp. GCM10027626]|uniref:hypothetical protein n=1 Tax=Paenibacillus sp. GCM10027626 TaxID=3273411 RepID=UPI0036D2EE42
MRIATIDIRAPHQRLALDLLQSPRDDGALGGVRSHGFHFGFERIRNIDHVGNMRQQLQNGECPKFAAPPRAPCA